MALLPMADFVALFPGTDCGECEVPTCRHHAKLILIADRDPARCPYLEDAGPVTRALESGVQMGRSRIFRNGAQYVGIKPCALDGQITIDYRAPGEQVDLDAVARDLPQHFPRIDVCPEPSLRMVNASRGELRIHVYLDGRTLIRGLPEDDLAAGYVVIDLVEGHRGETSAAQGDPPAAGMEG